MDMPEEEGMKVLYGAAAAGAYEDCSAETGDAMMIRLTRNAGHGQEKLMLNVRQIESVVESTDGLETTTLVRMVSGEKHSVVESIEEVRKRWGIAIVPRAETYSVL